MKVTNSYGIILSKSHDFSFVTKILVLYLVASINSGKTNTCGGKYIMLRKIHNKTYVPLSSK